MLPGFRSELDRDPNERYVPPTYTKEQQEEINKNNEAWEK